MVVTYAQVAAHPTQHRARTENRRTLVILDEIHHAGDAKSWGDAVREAFEPSDPAAGADRYPVPQRRQPDPVRHLRARAGRRRSARRPTTPTGTPRRCADGVVRPGGLPGLLRAGQLADQRGQEFTARLGEPLTAEQTARAWRTALDPHGDWMPAVLRAADTRLAQLGRRMPDAGGLVIATDQTTARAYAELLREITGEPAGAGAVRRPDARRSGSATFAASDDRWMVAVRMVSEGVDVPRLAVGVYATSASTPLYFAQAIGRFVRSARAGETASVFLPSVPGAAGLAGELEAQRDHVLGQAAPRAEEGCDDDLLADANKQKDEPGEEEKAFTSLRRRRRAGPGDLRRLLVRDRDLRRQRRGGRLPRAARAAGRRADARAAAAAAEGAGHCADAARTSARCRRRQVAERATAGAQLSSLRRELNSLVAMHHHRTGKPHGVVHNELRSRLGGPVTAMATADQLRERIAALRTWK